MAATAATTTTTTMAGTCSDMAGIITITVTTALAWASLVQQPLEA